jgi:peptidoglycan/LPS O-acetylase OafA/YrhL
LACFWSCGATNDCKPKDERDPRILPHFMTLPPFWALWNSHVAVGIFFVLSGFVLPLNYFKKARNNDLSANDTIISGMFRRYWRLMIPVLTSYSIYFFFKQTNILGHNTLTNGPGERTYGNIFQDGIWLTWFGANNWIGATWTLGTEFFATYFVYVLA